jgi:sn-glycerol 3-phosphate transport system substrate-binding protein
MRCVRYLLLVALLLPACGGDGSDSAVSSTGGCLGEVPKSQTPVKVTVAPPTGPVDQEGAQALLSRFNRSQDRVDVAVHDPGWPPERKIGELYAGVGADMVPVRSISLPALVDDRLIVAPPSCVLEVIEDLTDVARARATFDDRPWAVPFGSQALFLLYEREAFSAAGLDPDRPPLTVRELLDVARKLRAAGFELPLVSRFPGHPVNDAKPFEDPDDIFDSGGASAEILELLRTMVSEGLMSAEPPPGTPEGTPAIGTDEVAMEIGDLGLVWAIGSALAEGQAPGVSVSVAAVPGVNDPQVGDFGDVIVVAAASTDAEQAGAWAFLAWLAQPAQQADVHLLGDLLPVDADAIETAPVKKYWAQNPLFREAWDALAEHGGVTRVANGLPPWVYGGSIEHAINDVLFADAEPNVRFAQAEAEIEHRREAWKQDSEGFFACSFGDDPAACERLDLPVPQLED